jgi:hypothetical protein
MTDPVVLRRLGLHHGEPIRFRRGGRGRWVIGRVAGVSADGSITLRDPDGAARSLRPDDVEVQRPGPRGRRHWQTVSDVAVTWEQLSLWD